MDAEEQPGSGRTSFNRKAGDAWKPLSLYALYMSNALDMVGAAILVALVATLYGAGGRTSGPPPKAAEKSARNRPIEVGGKYWSAYFVGSSRDPSMGNFTLFGIFPARFKADGSFVAEDFENGTWKMVSGGKVALKTKRRSMTFRAEDGGDVLVAEKAIDFGMDNNTIRFLRDNPASRRRILGRYDVSKAGSQAKLLGQSLTFTESLVVRKDPHGDVDSKWIAAGDYVILLGEHDRAYAYPSFVLRVEQEGRVLRFKPSDPEPEFSPEKWEIVYKRAR